MWISNTFSGDAATLPRLGSELLVKVARGPSAWRPAALDRRPPHQARILFWDLKQRVACSAHCSCERGKPRKVACRIESGLLRDRLLVGAQQTARLEQLVLTPRGRRGDVSLAWRTTPPRHPSARRAAHRPRVCPRLLRSTSQQVGLGTKTCRPGLPTEGWKCAHI